MKIRGKQTKKIMKKIRNKEDIIRRKGKEERMRG
jgi:hypothetical protein